MKKCAYCGRENEDAAVYCRECGTEVFVVPSRPPPPPMPVIEKLVEPSEPEPDVAPGAESVLCTACLFPNLPEATWCKSCGAPIGPTTGLVPTDLIRTSGFAYRGAVQRSPSLVVLVGVWVLFLPCFVGCLGFLLVGLFEGWGGPGGLFFVWMSVILGGISVAMLYHATRNYLRILKNPPDAED
jgi:hypothetical protein